MTNEKKPILETIKIFVAKHPSLIEDGLFLFALILLGIGCGLERLSFGFISVAVVLLFVVLKKEGASRDTE